MKKFTLAVVLVLAVLLAIAACAPAAAPAPAQPADPAAPAQPADEAAPAPADSGMNYVANAADVVIGYNAGTESLEFFNKVYGGMKYEADKAGVKFLYAVSNFEAEQIIPKIETLIMQGANVLVDFNVNAEVGGNIVSIAKEKGIAGVVGIDVEYFAADGSRSWFMGANNQQAGELCGKAIAEYAKENKDGKLEKLVLFFNSENGDEVKKRMGGAIDGLAKEGITLTEDQIEWIDLGGGGSDTTIAGKDKFTAWLTANPNVKSVGTVAVNDETTQGILAAAETLNRQDDCILASHNVSQQYVDTVKAGGAKSWVGSVAYYPEKYGSYIVPLCIDIAMGKNTDPDTKVTMNHVFVYQKDLDAYLASSNEYMAQWK